MSGIGKGVIAASIGKILQVRGLKVTAAKVDPYLNYDAGTMNPYIHGEVFVTEDGGETDMDIGTYERFLDINVPKSHNITTGQIYSSVIERERKGDFLGKCVQIIPHITDEIKDRLRSIAREGADVVLVEIGGTVGDIESLPYLEAARQFRFDEGIGNVINVHVTLVPMLDVVGEQKTKPTASEFSLTLSWLGARCLLDRSPERRSRSSATSKNPQSSLHRTSQASTSRPSSSTNKDSAVTLSADYN